MRLSLVCRVALDDRVVAAIAVGPNTGFPFGDRDFDYSGTPLLLARDLADAGLVTLDPDTLGGASERGQS